MCQLQAFRCKSIKKYICKVSAKNKLPREYLTAADTGVDEEKDEAAWEGKCCTMCHLQVTRGHTTNDCKRLELMEESSGRQCQLSCSATKMFVLTLDRNGSVHQASDLLIGLGYIKEIAEIIHENKIKDIVISQ